MKLSPKVKVRRARAGRPRMQRRGTRSSWRPKLILVPTDFSYAADHALQHAVHLGRQLRAGIALLHVVAPVLGPDLLFTSIRTDQPQMVELSKQRLGRLARRAEMRPRQQLVRTGPAAEEIIRCADELKADLIVIGSHGHGAVERILIGGTTERVVRHAHCPVLVIPAPGLPAVRKPSRQQRHSR